MNNLHKFIILAFALVSPLLAQTRSTVSQVFYRADGSFCTGNVSIAWKTFYSSDGRLIQAGNILVPVSLSGQFTVSIEAPASYTVSYQLLPSSCSPVNELWQVPFSGTALSISQVRAINPPPSFTNIPLSYLARTQALVGQGICEQSNGLWAPGNCFGDSFMTPFVVNSQGPWDNSLPADAVVGGISTAGGMTAFTVDHDRFLITNVYGHYVPNTEGYRPNGVTGDLHVPADATSYEACSGCFIILGKSPMTNNVGISAFAVSDADGPEGTATSIGPAVTRVTGPCFNPAWIHSINTGFNFNGGGNFLSDVTDCDHLTLLFDPGNQTAVPWNRHIVNWTANFFLSDWQAGLHPTGPGFNHATLIGIEMDIGVSGNDTDVLAYSTAVGGLTQPKSALAYVVNGGTNDAMGTPISFTCGLCIFDATTQYAIQIGVSGHAAGGSMPIIMFSRDDMGRVASTQFNATPGGAMLLAMGSDVTQTLNPAFIVTGGDTAFVFTVQGKVPGVGHGVITAAGNTQFDPGTATLAELNASNPAAGGSAIMRCTDCQSVRDNGVTAGVACVTGGFGALAIKAIAGWACI